MEIRGRWSWILCGTGILALLTGCAVPGYGPQMILPGSGLIALGALIGHPRRR